MAGCTTSKGRLPSAATRSQTRTFQSLGKSLSCKPGNTLTTTNRESAYSLRTTSSAMCGRTAPIDGSLCADCPRFSNRSTRGHTLNWRRTIAHLNVLDLGVQLLLAVLAVIGVGI